MALKLECNNSISYRHKKFDMRRPRTDEEELHIKEELISRMGTPASSSYNEEDTSSQCSSEFMLSLPKRRRLNSTICDGSNESESASSSQSLPPSISPEALRDICKYHGNMVRKFPKKERTPKDQDRRNKNTIACRMSRRVKKLEHLAIEEQYKEFTNQHLKIVEESMRATAYFNHLNQLVKHEQVKSPAPVPIPLPSKNFSIDYLINGIKRKQC
ncbi:protein Mabiki [Drosophila grimshawi]|uniref:GH25114 n=1 Tax=Drosophila grimshawi TaxID=7222 RepID=B4JZC9_DROGR|nr:protein Mabiki [Drosophila grimshawi]EDV94051.1 GH25114 [Drosophila grimshawi]